MESVAQVNNMAQFMRLVSEARTRNSNAVNNVAAQRNPFEALRMRAQTMQSQTPAAAAPSRTSSSGSVYTNSRILTNNISIVAADHASAPQQNTRVLGTKFDAYA
jgi:hypothetical protein